MANEHTCKLPCSCASCFITIVHPAAGLAWTHLVMTQTLPACGSGDATEGIRVSKGLTHMKASFAITRVFRAREGPAAPFALLV